VTHATPGAVPQPAPVDGATPVRLHAASLARLADLGAAQLGHGPRPVVPGDPLTDGSTGHAVAAAGHLPADGAAAVTLERTRRQLRDLGIAHGSLLDAAWAPAARTLAAPLGQLRLEQHLPTDGGPARSARIDGWLGPEGVVLAAHAGGTERDVIVAPSADTLPALVLALTGTVAAPTDRTASETSAADPSAPGRCAVATDPSASDRGPDAAVRGSGDPADSLAELRGWRHRWRLRIGWRHTDDPQPPRGGGDGRAPADPPGRDAAATDDLAVVIAADGRPWLVLPDPDAPDGWLAGPVSVVELWAHLLDRLPRPAPAPATDAWRTCRRPELGLVVDVPARWTLVPSHHGDGIVASAPDRAGPPTSVSLLRRWSAEDPLHGLVAPLVLEVAADHLGGVPATRTTVHHLDADGWPVCSLVWSPHDDEAERRLDVVAQAAAGRTLDDLDVLLAVVRSIGTSDPDATSVDADARGVGAPRPRHGHEPGSGPVTSEVPR
jgi:hypothetical protein